MGAEPRCCICSVKTRKGKNIIPHGIMCPSCSYCFFCWKRKKKWLKKVHDR